MSTTFWYLVSVCLSVLQGALNPLSPGVWGFPQITKLEGAPVMAEAGPASCFPEGIEHLAADLLEESSGSEEAGPEDPLPAQLSLLFPLIFK